MNLNLTKIEFKKLVLRALYFTQIIFFAYNFFWGNSGFLSLRSFKSDNLVLSTKITDQEHKVETLKKKINDWKSNLFLKEKIARESLQMAKPGDQIYILT